MPAAVRPTAQETRHAPALLTPRPRASASRSTPTSRCLPTAALALGLLCAPLLNTGPALAGSYVGTCTASGAFTGDDPQGGDNMNPPGDIGGSPPETDTAGGGGGCGAGAFSYMDSTVQGMGTLSASFTWQPDDPNNPQADPPPQCVIQEVIGQASWYCQPTGTGKCDDGLGGKAYSISDAYGAGQESDSDTFTVVPDPGNSFSAPSCSPSASADGPPPSQVDAGVSYAVNVYPVTIQITGAPTTTTGAAGGPPEAMAGEQITASIAGLPSGFSIVSCNWSTSGGSPFATFDPQLTSNQQVPLNPPTNGSPLTFYDIGNEDKVYVNCTAVVQPPTPSGGTAPPTLSVSLQSQPVTFIKPSLANWIIEHGYVQDTGGDVLTLAAAPQSGQSNGEDWTGVAVNFPSSLPQALKSGTAGFAQLTTPTYTYSPVNSNPEPNNGMIGLDTTFPLVTWSLSVPNGGTDSAYGPEEGDSPGTPAFSATTVTANEQFTTWLMFEPPYTGSVNNAIWVPIASYQWDWGGTATLTGGVWVLSGLSPATAGGGGVASPSSTYPTWTLIHVH